MNESKASFVDEVESLFQRHGYRDWAVIVRKKGEAPERWCVAGDGKSFVLDREAMACLHYELADLQATIMEIQRQKEREYQTAKARQNRQHPA